jgi:hypothetical protein
MFGFFFTGMVFNVNVGFADLTMKKDGKDKKVAIFLGDTAMVNDVSYFTVTSCD